jgi:hypothetical protein
MGFGLNLKKGKLKLKKKKLKSSRRGRAIHCCYISQPPAYTTLTSNL